MPDRQMLLPAVGSVMAALRLVDLGNGEFALAVSGPVAAGQSAAGAPMPVGADYFVSPPVLGNGQRGTLQVGSCGALRVQIMQPNGYNPTGYTDIAADAASNTILSSHVRSYGMVMNPAGAWDRMRGDVNGQWVKAPALAKVNRSLTASTSSAQAAAAKAARSRLLIKSTDASIVVYVNLGAAATSGSGSIAIPPGGLLELEGTTEAVFIIAASGSPVVTIWEF